MLRLGCETWGVGDGVKQQKAGSLEVAGRRRGWRFMKSCCGVRPNSTIWTRRASRITESFSSPNTFSALREEMLRPRNSHAANAKRWQEGDWLSSQGGWVPHIIEPSRSRGVESDSVHMFSDLKTPTKCIQLNSPPSEMCCAPQQDFPYFPTIHRQALNSQTRQRGAEQHIDYGVGKRCFVVSVGAVGEPKPISNLWRRTACMW